MEKVRKIIAIVILLGVFCFTAQAAEGQDSTKIFNQDPFTKLFRGISNVIESPAELGCQTREPYYDSPDKATWKFFRGVSAFVGRAVMGTLEIATFLFPGDSNLKPVCDNPYYRPV